MDGFEGNTGIIVVAATNRADILDPALLRPGRFDRQVSVDVPDAKGRLQILKVHARNKRLNDEVDLSEIAQRTPGFSGADLANLLNEAAILTGRRNKAATGTAEIDDSVDRIVAGMEGTPMVDGKSKSLVAYHEVGHALCGTLTPGHDSVQKVCRARGVRGCGGCVGVGWRGCGGWVCEGGWAWACPPEPSANPTPPPHPLSQVTLIPRGQARGLTWFLPGEDPSLISKQQIFARIVGALGGRAAEEVVFGDAEVTTGASSDLQMASGGGGGEGRGWGLESV